MRAGILGMCVSSSWYLCTYIGKENDRREIERGASGVKDSVQPYYGTGRNVTCDNFFTSKDVGEHLLTQCMTIADTEVKSSEYWFVDTTALVSSVPKQNKNVALLSQLSSLYNGCRKTK